jgi:hypothetical protein
MKKPTYWIDLFTGTTWEEFLKAGGNITGKWNSSQPFSYEEKGLLVMVTLHFTS